MSKRFKVHIRMLVIDSYKPLDRGDDNGTQVEKNSTKKNHFHELTSGLKKHMQSTLGWLVLKRLNYVN